MRTYFIEIETRHDCSQGDELSGYTFLEHDARNAAVQVIKDPLNNVEITTSFLKVPGQLLGPRILTILSR